MNVELFINGILIVLLIALVIVIIRYPKTLFVSIPIFILKVLKGMFFIDAIQIFSKKKKNKSKKATFSDGF